MSFAWVIVHNVWSKKARSILTGIAVAIGVMTVVTLGVVTQSVKTTAAGVLQVGKADFTVAQKNVSDILDSALTETQLQRVQHVPGVGSAIGVLLDTEKLNAQNPLLVEIGIAPQDLTPFGVSVSPGRTFGANASTRS
jgi:putative ABC transport system permease protein